MKRSVYFISFLIIILFSYQFVFSEEANTPLIVKSKFFSIYADRDFDLDLLLDKINFNYFLHPDGLLKKSSRDKKEILATTLDTIFLEVSDILDIHIYSFQGRIEILVDQNAVSSVFKNFFAQDFTERSFYIPEKNAIYLSFADLTLGLLGHEIAHAIISRYFVVPPPAKVQEVLSGYVEYKLRKSTD